MLIAIADRCDDEGTCYPGINKLAKKCNVQRRQAINLIQDLERLGEIRVAEGQGVKTNGGATNRYYMTGYIKANNLPIDETNFRDIEPKKSRKKKEKTTPVQPVTPRATFDATPVQHSAKVVQPAAPNTKLDTKKEIPSISPIGESPVSENEETSSDIERNKQITALIKAWLDGQKAKRVKPKNDYQIPINRDIMGLLVDKGITPDDVTRYMLAKAKPTGFHAITWLNNDILGWLNSTPQIKATGTAATGLVVEAERPQRREDPELDAVEAELMRRFA